MSDSLVRAGEICRALEGDDSPLSGWVHDASGGICEPLEVFISGGGMKFWARADGRHASGWRSGKHFHRRWRGLGALRIRWAIRRWDARRRRQPQTAPA